MKCKGKHERREWLERTRDCLIKIHQMMLEFSSLSSSSPNAGRDVKNPEGTVLAKKTSIEKKNKKKNHVQFSRKYFKLVEKVH